MHANPLPLACELNVISLEPIGKLWHVPKVQPGYCPGCERKVDKALLNFNNQDWHPECFRCSLCRQAFPDNKCIIRDDLILHDDCFKQCFEERCAVCNEYVKKRKNKLPVEAFNKTFHAKCFKCTRCQSTLDPSKFYQYYSMPYCNDCVEKMSDYFPKCLTCTHPINESTTQAKTFYFQGTKYYVHDPTCYKCKFCAEEIGDETNCRVHENYLICKKCYDQGMEKICAYCNEPIFDQGSNMGNVFWHTAHFRCTKCLSFLKSDACEFRYGVLKCKGCAIEDKPRCANCNLPINSNPINACGLLFHPKCLVCPYCNKSLISHSFSRVRGKPCCMKCFRKLVKEKKIDEHGNPIIKKMKKKDKKRERQMERIQEEIELEDEQIREEQKKQNKKEKHGNKHGVPIPDDDSDSGPRSLAETATNSDVLLTDEGNVAANAPIVPLVSESSSHSLDL